MRCARTNNHTVREAACACIAELAAKVDAEAVMPHLATMMRALLTCLRDDSWPVRTNLHATSTSLPFKAQLLAHCPSPDSQIVPGWLRQYRASHSRGSCSVTDEASYMKSEGQVRGSRGVACPCCRTGAPRSPALPVQVRDAALLASARCARALPEGCRLWLPDLEPLWISHLDDNIPSVREDAAIALGDAVRAYGDEANAKILPVLRWAAALRLCGHPVHASCACELC